MILKKNKGKIVLTISVFLSGVPILKDDNTYETNKTKIKMIFSDIKENKYNNELINDEIGDFYINYIDQYAGLVFKDLANNPILYIIAKKVEYEEIK